MAASRRHTGADGPSGHRRLYGGGYPLHCLRTGRSGGGRQRAASGGTDHRQPSGCTGCQKPQDLPQLDGGGHVSGRPGAYNQALMDLGATVCLPSGAPLCRGLPRRGLLHSPAGGLSGPVAGALPQAGEADGASDRVPAAAGNCGGAAAAPGYGTAGGAVGVPPCTGSADGGGGRPAAANVGGKPHQVDKSCQPGIYSLTFAGK